MKLNKFIKRYDNKRHIKRFLSKFDLERLLEGLEVEIGYNSFCHPEINTIICGTLENFSVIEILSYQLGILIFARIVIRGLDTIEKDFFNAFDKETIGDFFRTYICKIDDPFHGNDLVEMLLKKYRRNFIQRIWFNLCQTIKN